MNFINEEHELFFVNKMKELYNKGKTDTYYTSLIYALGICKTTREHFEEIFDTQNGEINVNAINQKWQTSTSSKVTRLAFSLWNGCMYDSEKDFENEKMSAGYNISEIFSCSYAPYFYKAIMLKYPEYTEEKQHEIEL